MLASEPPPRNLADVPCPQPPYSTGSSLCTAGSRAPKLPYAHRGDLGQASAGGGRGRVCRRCGRGGADVLAVDVLGVADERRPLLAAGVALLEAVELKFWHRSALTSPPSRLGHGCGTHWLGAFRRNPWWWLRMWENVRAWWSREGRGCVDSRYVTSARGPGGRAGRSLTQRRCRLAVSANSVPRRYGRLLQWAGRAKRRKVCGRERVCRGYVIKALEEIRGAGRDKRGGGGQDGMARNTSGP